jgi:hypothetical protein
MIENLEGSKIWVGDDEALSEAAQKYGIARGWQWGGSFGGSNIKKNINFITFRTYVGERRMFCGVDGKTDRQAFDNKGFTLLTPSDIGYTTAPKKQTTPIGRGTKVKLLTMKGFPGESIFMESRLSVGGIYTVRSYKEHYSDSSIYEPGIELLEGNAWYPLSAFCIVPTSTAPEYKPVIMGSKITHVSDMCVGLWVTFQNKISPWNSSGGGKDPKNIPDDHYPYTGKITGLPNSDGLLIDDMWGFSREESVRRGVIRVATSEEISRATAQQGSPFPIVDSSGSMGSAIVTSTPTVKYDPTNIRVDNVSKAAPKKTEFIKIDPLPFVSVPRLGRRLTREIPRITSHLTGISI